MSAHFSVLKLVQFVQQKTALSGRLFGSYNFQRFPQFWQTAYRTVFLPLCIIIGMIRTSPSVHSAKISHPIVTRPPPLQPPALSTLILSVFSSGSSYSAGFVLWICQAGSRWNNRKNRTNVYFAQKEPVHFVCIFICILLDKCANCEYNNNNELRRTRNGRR